MKTSKDNVKGSGSKALAKVFRVVSRLLFVFIAAATVMAMSIVGIPLIAGYFADSLGLQQDTPIIVLIVNWGIPVLFAAGFLFVVTLWILRWLNGWMNLQSAAISYKISGEPGPGFAIVNETVQPLGKATLVSEKKGNKK